jgi:acyl-CoA thioesterase FadM
MNLYLRLLRVLARALRAAGSLGPLDTSVLRFRVMPHDLDLNLHVNNGRYFTLMDLGRVDLLARLGLVRPIVRERWMPVVAAATLRFKRSLDPFDAFTVHTRLLCWDEKWFYLAQHFERDGRVVAEGTVRALFKGRGGVVASAVVIASSGHPTPASPPMPEAVRLWVAGLDGDPAVTSVAPARSTESRATV